MFKINAKQLAACAEVSTRSFADKVTRHLVEALPSQAAAVGTPAIQGMVEKGIEQAASHGITARKDVCLFLAASAALGDRLGADPKLSFVTDLLGPDNPLDVAAKVQQLWTVVQSDFWPEDAPDEGSESSTAEASTAIAVELAEAAHTDLAGPLPVVRPVVPCPLRPRHYPFSL